MLSFPPNFLWGVSTAAFQFEGGDGCSQWHSWEREGKVRSGHRRGAACDWWRDPTRDLEACRALGLNSLRLSIEWSRIEPQPGVIDNQAIGRYRSLLDAVRKFGMRPFVTLHHFTHPQWFEDRGAFLAENSAERFAEFATLIANSFGDLCSDWVTFNEPNVYAVFGYVFGEFPPARRTGVRECALVLRNIHRAHALAYKEIHAVQKDASVGLTTNWVEFQPASPSPGDRLLAHAYDTFFNRSSLHLLRTGALPFPFGKLVPDGPELADRLDFIGLNVYNRLHIRSGFDENFMKTGGVFVPAHAPQGDRGVELPYGEACPDAVISAAKEYSVLGVPIYILENGVPDRQDRIRPWVLVQTVRKLAELSHAGYDVRGYFHWSLVDNFEWNEGWQLRFGLYELDPETQVRKPRRSADIYREIIRNHGVSDKLLSRFSEQPAAGEAAHGRTFP